MQVRLQKIPQILFEYPVIVSETIYIYILWDSMHRYYICTMAARQRTRSIEYKAKNLIL